MTEPVYLPLPSYAPMTLTDVEYFYRRLTAACGIPKEYLGVSEVYRLDPPKRLTRLERVLAGLEPDPYAAPCFLHDYRGAAYSTRRDLPTLSEAQDLQKPPPAPLPVDDPSGDDVARDLTNEELRAWRNR